MPQYAYKCPKCGVKTEQVRTVREHSETELACPECRNVAMVTDFSVQKPLIVIRESWSAHTQYDYMDPRAFAGRGSADRRDFVNETYGDRDLLTGTGPSFPSVEAMEAHAEANDATIISDDHLEPVGA